MAELIAVKGLPELHKFLSELPEKLEKNVLRAALSKGARELRDIIKPRVPIGVPNSEGVRLYKHYEGALRDSLRVSSRIKSGKVTASVKVGGKIKGGTDVFYAHFLEYGTAKHLIIAKNGKSLFVGGHNVSAVRHPGAQAKPFMRPALDINAAKITIVIAEAIKTRLDKQGLDVADLDFEVEE